MDTDDVTVTATISYERGGITANIVYKVGRSENSVAMTGPAEGGQFTGVIPAQPSGSEVTFKVVANNKDNIEAEATGSYTVGAAPQDYTKLRINELNGTTNSSKSTTSEPLKSSSKELIFIKIPKNSFGLATTGNSNPAPIWFFIP